MARKITTVIAITGEGQYRQKVNEINKAQDELRAGLAATSAEFASNANSMDALRAKGEALNKLYAEQEKNSGGRGAEERPEGPGGGWLEAFARIAGMSAVQFSTAWGGEGPRPRARVTFCLRKK